MKDKTHLLTSVQMANFAADGFLIFPELIPAELNAEAMREIDDPKREAIIREATIIAMDDTAIAPLHIQRNAWAMRRGLALDARVDELTRAQDVTPTGPAR